MSARSTWVGEPNYSRAGTMSAQKQKNGILILREFHHYSRPTVLEPRRPENLVVENVTQVKRRKKARKGNLVKVHNYHQPPTGFLTSHLPLIEEIDWRLIYWELIGLHVSDSNNKNMANKKMSLTIWHYKLAYDELLAPRGIFKMSDQIHEKIGFPCDSLSYIDFTFHNVTLLLRLTISLFMQLPICCCQKVKNAVGFHSPFSFICTSAKQSVKFEFSFLASVMAWIYPCRRHWDKTHLDRLGCQRPCMPCM